MQNAPSTIDPPLNVIGNYQLLSTLGSGGGGGVVYKARQQNLQTTVALKTLNLTRVHSALTLQRFQREMLALGRLRHPNIVRAVDAGEADGYLYIAMEFFEGLDLSRVLRNAGQLALADACEIARQTALGLEFIAQNDMVHRDIKPSNLHLGADGTVRILDLGLARLEPTAENAELTATGQVMGTGDFIAPEQGIGSRDIDIRVDLYSLGCTLYALLAGRPPFHDCLTFFSKVKAHVERPVPPLENFRQGIPKGLQTLLMQVLEKDPAKRLASPHEIAKTLEPFCTTTDLSRLYQQSTSKATVPEVNSPNVHVSTVTDRPPDPLQTVVLPRRQVGRWLTVFGSLFLLIPLSIWLAWLFVFSSHPTENHLVPANVVPEDNIMKPGVWFDLLQKEPTVTLWPKTSDISRWDLDREKKQLWVSCETQGMLALAEVESDGFDLEVTFVQTPWVGGIGVFYRGREVKHLGGNRAGADLLMLGRSIQPNISEPTRLERGELQRANVSNDPSFAWFKAATIPKTLPGSHRLALTVSGKQLQSVTWDGLPPLKDTVCDPLPSVTPREGGHGSVGIFVRSCSAVIQQARIRLHPPLEPVRE